MLWWLGEISVVLWADNPVIKHNSIDGKSQPSSVVLLATCQEGLGEEESTDPERGRRSIVDPILHELQSLDEIIDIGTKRLETRVRFRFPHCRDLVVVQRVSHCFERLGQDDFSLNSLAEVNERRAYNSDQTVESQQFLEKYGIHRFFIHDWMFFLG